MRWLPLVEDGDVPHLGRGAPLIKNECDGTARPLGPMLLLCGLTARLPNGNARRC